MPLLFSYGTLQQFRGAFGLTFQQKFLIVALLNAAVALILAARMPSARIDGNPQSHARLSVSVWLAAVSGALLLVGVVSNTLLRHAIQISPLALALVVTVRRSPFGAVVALPLFTFWLFVMGGIWLFLLGIAPVFTGRFSSSEVILTIVIGLASICGLIDVMRQGTTLSLATRLGTVLAFAILQPVAMVLSF
jgi:hypothetical protein